MHNTNKGRKFSASASVLSREELDALMGACSTTCPTGVRNKAIVAVLAASGLRSAELLGLRPGDLDEKRGTVVVKCGKGGKDRTVGMSPWAFDAVARWMHERKTLRIKRDAPLFCTLKGEALQTHYLRALLPRLAKKAGITRRVHPHGCRHSLGAALAHAGTPINVIAVQLGHRSSATTARYIDHIAPPEAINAMRKDPWSATGTLVISDSTVDSLSPLSPGPAVEP